MSNAVNGMQQQSHRRQVVDDRLRHAGAGQRLFGAAHVDGSHPSAQHRFDGALDRSRLVFERTSVAQQHRRRCDRGDRVGDVLTGDVGCGTMDRLEQTAFATDARRREEPERSDDGAGLVRQDVPEEIAGEEHVELAGIGTPSSNAHESTS